jgi:hypothetical protein
LSGDGEKGVRRRLSGRRVWGADCGCGVGRGRGERLEDEVVCALDALRNSAHKLIRQNKRSHKRPVVFQKEPYFVSKETALHKK